MKIQNTKETLQATHANLSRPEFNDVILQEATFTNVNWSKASFTDINFSGAKFSKLNQVRATADSASAPSIQSSTGLGRIQGGFRKSIESKRVKPTRGAHCVRCG